MQQSLFTKYQHLPKKTPVSERGEMFDFFIQMLNPQRLKDGYPPLTHARLGYLLAGIPTKDLYALRSKMESAMHRRFNPGVVFWKEIKAN
jgi:hypothetical protein